MRDEGEEEEDFLNHYNNDLEGETRQMVASSSPHVPPLPFLPDVHLAYALDAQRGRETLSAAGVPPLTPTLHLFALPPCSLLPAPCLLPPSPCPLPPTPGAAHPPTSDLSPTPCTPHPQLRLSH